MFGLESPVANETQTGFTPQPLRAWPALTSEAGTVAPDRRHSLRRPPTTAYDKGRMEWRSLASVTRSDKSFCSRAQRQPQTLSVPTTLPLYLGHGDPARATSCQFDGAPGARQDAGIHAELSPRQKNVGSRLRERCLPPRFSSDEVHLTRFVGHVQRNSGVGGRQSRLRSSGCASARLDIPACLLRNKVFFLLVIAAQRSIHDTCQKPLAFLINGWL